MADADDFFDEPEEHSRIKSQIVSTYFAIWAKIMARQSQRIGYIDFFAGPGRYGSGQPSTPLIILEHAIDDLDLAPRLVSMFNDANAEHMKSLEAEINSLPGIKKLKNKPQLLTGTISEELIQYFEKTNTIPALTFLDPFGYKDLTLRIISAVMKDFGCEAIFFFNHNRINMGITNPKVQHHMKALFGKKNLNDLKQAIVGKSPAGREAAVAYALREALREAGWQYLIMFTFRRKTGRISHYLCFVSKHHLGFSIMKKVMAGVGRTDGDGIPLFDYVPDDDGKQLPLSGSGRLNDLANDLLRTYSGTSVTVGDICKIEGENSLFLDRNYKDALKQLEADGRIVCEPDWANRKKNTIADRVKVSFPPA